jgi:muconolactone delta-isomerase
MQFLAICRRRIESYPAEAFDALLADEAEAARALYAEGTVRSAWSREDVPGACFLIESPSLGEATAAVASLPFAKANMLELQVIPVRGYRGFGPRA